MAPLDERIERARLEREAQEAKLLATGKPWYRRAWDWATDAHTFLVKFAALCAFTIGAHAYIKGLITKTDLRNEVRSAVDEAIEEKRISRATTEARLNNLETATNGVPEWRGATTVKVEKLLDHMGTAETNITKLQNQFDGYRIRK